MGRAGSKMDDSNSLSYDPFGRIFTLNMRHYDMYAIARNLDNPELEAWTICPPYYPLDWRRINKRRIWQTESADMIHWSEPYAVLTPEDGEDGLDETYYGFYPFAVGGVRLGFLNTMSYVSNEIEVRLVYSRDGKTWRHLNKRRPFLAPRGEGHWDSYMSTITHDPIRVGDELYIYHGGASNHHDWWISGARKAWTCLRSPNPTESTTPWDWPSCGWTGSFRWTPDPRGAASCDAPPDHGGPAAEGQHAMRRRGLHRRGDRRSSRPGHSRLQPSGVRHLPGRLRRNTPSPGTAGPRCRALPSEPAPYPAPEFERFRKIRSSWKKLSSFRSHSPDQPHGAAVSSRRVGG